jgi:hypothetical protein
MECVIPSESLQRVGRFFFFLGNLEETLSPRILKILKSTTGRTQRSYRKCVLRINGRLNAECGLSPSSSAFGTTFLFLFQDQCAMYFFLKVHLLNQQWLSSRTIFFHVINPHGVPLRANNVL